MAALVIAAATVLGAVSVADAQNAGQWKLTTGSMAVARRHATVTALPDGRVLVAGGNNPATPNTALASAELYDPATDSFTSAGNMTVGRTLHTATLLPDGTVLIAGGWNVNTSLNSAEIYNPKTGQFIATEGSMNQDRSQHTATLLGNGHVLIAAGWGTTGPSAQGPVLNAETYNPSTGSFIPTGNLAVARNTHTATRLLDGRVLIAGGFGASGALNSAETFSPGTGTFAATGNMQVARAGHGAELFPSGQVLIFGSDPDTDIGGSKEIYDPGAGTFGNLAFRQAVRSWPAITPLPGGAGAILVAGGVGVALADWRLQDAGLSSTLQTTTSLQQDLNPMTTARWGTDAVMLQNQRILVAGGGSATAELYCPANRPFRFVGPAPQFTVNEGATVTFKLDTTLCDNESAIVGFDLPTGALFDPATRTFTWTPDSGQAGTYFVSFALLGGGEIQFVTDTREVKIVVNDTITDPDGDGVFVNDNCPNVANPDQSDQDGDGTGDLCDPTPLGQAFASVVSNTTTIAPPASPTGFAPGEAINVTATVTFQPGPEPYYAVRPTQYNVVALVDGVAGADRILEAPPLQLWVDNSTSPPTVSPDLVLVDSTTGPVTLSTTFALTDFYTNLPLGQRTVTLEYVNLAKDPDAATNGVGCAPPADPTDCVKIWLGVAQAGSQTITIRNISGAQASFDPLIALIRSFNLRPITTAALIGTVRVAQGFVQRSNINAACVAMAAFVVEVRFLSGRTLTPAQATQLESAAIAIRQLLGCR